jgi:rhodanese-related sulfurtransferase
MEGKMKKSVSALFCLFICFFLFFGCAGTAKPIGVTTISGEAQPIVETQLPESKRTDLGLYITAKEAYEQWKINPDRIKILDCRTPEEYAFVGHAPMAHNIPSKFFTYKFDSEKKEPVMVNNPDFLETIKKKFKTDDTIFVMCRSGGRSASSVNIMAKAGFINVYNIIDGFEGDSIKDSGSYFHGKRMRNGWKNSGAPWTYELNPNLMYLKTE